MYFRFYSNKGVVLCSNLPTELLEECKNCTVEYERKQCSVRNIIKRHGKKEFPDGYVYLCYYENNITSKIFNRHLKMSELQFPYFLESYKELQQKEQQTIRRLKHNIVTYNSNITQELYALISQDTLSRKNAKEQIATISNYISKNPKETTAAFIRILKNSNLINSEFNVFDLLVTENISELDFDSHSIHKVILLSLQPYWLDFQELEVNINIGACKEKVHIDYSSISVALCHIFNNATKYISINSLLDISFSETSDYINITFSMLSLHVEKYEENKIFEESYSGIWANKACLQGNGIGMFYVKKLVELNKGKVAFIPGDEINFQLKGIPYSRNKILIQLPKD